MSISGPGLAATFQYDAFGRRISKTINAASIGFLYDGVDIVQEQVAGSPGANMLVGGIDEVLTRTDASGTQSAIADALGSVVGLTDAAGAIQTQYSYEQFGKTSATGASSSNGSQYTGRENDGTGLYYYRARYYSPALQRFVSEDPIGFTGRDINLYAYVGNDPIAHLDPGGLERLSSYTHTLPSQMPPVRSRHFNRSPDYYSFSCSIGEGCRYAHQVIVDRYGNYYQAPVGAFGGVGTLVGVSLMFGYLNDYPDRAPRPQEVRDFILRHSVSVGAGCVGGINLVYSSGSGSSQEFGFTTPGAAATWTYTLDSPMNDYGAPPLGGRAGKH